MIKLFEEFKPNPRYKPHLILSTAVITLLIYIPCTFWIPLVVYDVAPAHFNLSWIIILAVFAALVAWICIWAGLYFKSVVYQLNNTEMTWRRGVLFRKTGIVPYDRITNVDIVQGPIMRIFKIFDLKLDTAGGSGKDKSEIRIEGVEDPEPLRALIMDYVRGKKAAPAALGTEYGAAEETDISAILEELRAIRKLLEKK
ncbi:MAG TPA: PH domain-containing protein [Methanocorpusculum sp.]|nr:PH domain-containing protein [Methanocorpusculum sp.]